MTCTHCGAETDGVALCAACKAGMLVRLEFVPIYFANLSRWRPERAGSRSVPASREPTGVGNPGSEHPSQLLLDETHAQFVGWGRALVDDRPMLELPHGGADEAETVRIVAAFLTDHLSTMLTLGWVGDLMRELGEYELRLRAFTEQIVPGWYAGACARCGTATYVVPGLTWVTCPSCGDTTHAGDHLDVILDEARDWVATTRNVAEAVVALTPEMSVARVRERIKKWDQRERIVAVHRLDDDGDPVGPKRYRLGDVLDLMASEREMSYAVPSSGGASMPAGA